MSHTDQAHAAESPNRPAPAGRPGPGTLRFSDADPDLPISSCFELDKALRAAELRCVSGQPIIVSLFAHGHQLQIGLGRPDSFVSFQRRGGVPVPGSIAIGDPQANRRTAFFFAGMLRTQIPARNLLPATKARQILREFYNTGNRSTTVEWEPF